MKKIILTVISCFLMYCMNTPQPNAQENNVRPSTKTDLVGRWILVNLVIDPSISSNTTDPWLSKYQIFEFADTGKMKHMISNKPITNDDLKIFNLRPLKNPLFRALSVSVSQIPRRC